MVIRSALLALAVVAGPLTSHPLHTSFTEITRERSGHVAISIRLFADDLGATLDSLGRLPVAQGAARDVIARRYFERSVMLTGRTGNVTLQWCGMKTVDDLTWLCARSSRPVADGKLRVRNTLLFDRFQDQLSIIRLSGKSGGGTRVLSSRSPEAILD